MNWFTNYPVSMSGALDVMKLSDAPMQDLGFWASGIDLLD